ncbi:MAG: RDD family protein [Methanosphaera stadtmanae]|nr:RDD family protein [Methanosphaera stadtmanae]
MEHFIKRFEAFIIDVIVVTLLTALLNNIFYVIFTLVGNPFYLAYYNLVVLIIVTLSYFTIYEAKTNKTIGKRIIHLYVSDEEGYMTYKKSFIRTLPKIFWIPLIFDVILGKLLNCPSRLFDRIANTNVYSDKELELVA